MKQYHKKYIWKRGAACMLAVAMVLTTADGFGWGATTAEAATPSETYDVREFNKGTSIFSKGQDTTISEGTGVECTYNGAKSLHVVKTDSEETGGVSISSSSAKTYKAFDLTGTEENDVLTYGAYFKSKESDAHIRLDLEVYNSSNTLLQTITGRSLIPSRDSKYSEWVKYSTKATLPANASYAVFRIVIPEGKADFYIDSVFGKITESYARTVADWSFFENASEWDGITVNGNVGTADGVVTRKIETLIPGCTYQIAGDYTASAETQFQIEYYDINNKLLEGKTQTLTLPTETSPTAISGLSFVVPLKALTAKVSYGKEEVTSTLSNYELVETEGRVLPGEDGWESEYIWYPEDATATGNQTRYFQTPLVVPDMDTKTVKSAWLQVAVDDVMVGDPVWNGVAQTVYNMNGIGDLDYSEEDKKNVKVFQIAKEKILSGENYLGFTVQNISSYAGLVFELQINYEDGSTYTFKSGVNCTTYVSKDETQDWQTTSVIENSYWKKSRRLGKPVYSEVGDATYFYGEDANGRLIIQLKTKNQVQWKAGETAVLKLTDTNMINIDGVGRKDIPITARIWNEERSEYIMAIKGTYSFNAWNDLQFTFEVPDYLAAGTYSILLDRHDALTYWNDPRNGIYAQRICIATIEQDTATTYTKAEVRKSDNGTTDLYLNDKEVSPIMYLRPSMRGLYKYNREASFQNSGVSIYSTNNAYFSGQDYYYAEGSCEANAIWQYNPDTDTSTINTEVLDREIIRTLALSNNKDTKLLVNVNIEAPAAWVNDPDNEGYLQKDADGNYILDESDEEGLRIKLASWASEEYQNDMKDVLTQVVRHIHSANYADRVIGIKISNGRTSEWMMDGVSSATKTDRSQNIKDGFLKYGKAIYGTEDAAYTKWRTTASDYKLPTVDECKNSNTALLNPGTQRKVIDFNNYLGELGADLLIQCGQVVKEVETNWIAGAYNGYLWFHASSEGIGSAHSGIDKILESNAIDFVSSPVAYSERAEGQFTGYMALVDSIQAHGKMYFLEQDNRTIYAQVSTGDTSDDSVGRTDTLKQSINQIRRDMTFDLVRGTGMWFFDMNGGWYDDESITDAIKQIKTEYDYHRDDGSNNEIAVYVPKDGYNYLVNDYGSNDATKTSYLMRAMYSQQREELANLGASYDTFMVEDALDGTITEDQFKQYKMSIVISPYELTDEEATKLKANLGQKGAVVIWIYMAGASNGGAYNAGNIKSLTGITVGLENSTGKLNASTTSVDKDGIQIAAGHLFGVLRASATTGPRPYVNDTSATAFARFPGGFLGIGAKDAAAYKSVTGTSGTYTSVYSATPNVPSEVLRAFADKAGVHRYSADASDVIETNNSYIAIHSAAGGEKTINLSQMQSEKYVYDVLQGKYLSVKNQKVTFQMESGQTRLLRVESEPTNMELAGTMEYQDVMESPTAYQDNLFYNGDFDGDDGSADTAGWVNVPIASGEEKINYGENLINYPLESGETGSITSVAGWNFNHQGDTDVLEIVEDSGEKAFKWQKQNEDTNNRYLDCYAGITLEAGATYELSIDVKSDCSTLQIHHYYSGESKPTGVYANWVTYTDIQSDEWQTKTIEFQAQEDCLQPCFQFVWDTGSRNSTMYMKKYQIRKVEWETKIVNHYGENLINYPLESGETGSITSVAGWNFNHRGDTDVLEIVEDSGEKAFKWKKQNGDTNNRYLDCYAGITLEAGATYELSIDVKSDCSTLQIHHYYSGESKPTGVYANWKTYTDIQSNEWQTKTIEFKAQEECLQPCFQFVWDTGSRNSTMYMKKYQIRKVTEDEVPVYIWTEGVGSHEEDSNVLMISQATEFWKNGVTVQEGKTYTYSMDVKVTDAGEGFTFRPYVYNFVEGGWQDITDMSVTADTNGWKKVTATFTAMKPNATDGTRFGFIRNGTGKVYLDNITLVEAEKEDEVPVDNMVSNGATLESWASMIQVPCFTGKGATGSVASKTLRVATTKYKTYIVKFRADVTGTNQIQVKLGTRTVDSVDLSEVSGWKEFTCEIGIKESTTDFAITTADGQTITWDNIRVYRKYDMGDANGDGVVDSRDLVRLKWNTSEKVSPNPLATYVFVDFTNHTGAFVDGNDMKAMRTWFCK